MHICIFTIVITHICHFSSNKNKVTKKSKALNLTLIDFVPSTQQPSAVSN